MYYEYSTRILHVATSGSGAVTVLQPPSHMMQYALVHCLLLSTVLAKLQRDKPNIVWFLTDVRPAWTIFTLYALLIVPEEIVVQVPDNHLCAIPTSGSGPASRRVFSQHW